MRWLVLLAGCSTQVYGRLVDAFTGEPVAGVYVAVDRDEARTDAHGEFTLDAPRRGHLALGGACALQPLDYESADLGSIRVARLRGFEQRVPDNIVEIEGMPASSGVLRHCMPDRAVNVTLADGTHAIIEPTRFQ